jgi:DNA-directed RNA polymerase subunit RPC12/RpoP
MVREEVKKYSCLNCGTPFDAYPPDDLHRWASRDPNHYKDNIKVTYLCKECKNENVIYWGYVAPAFAIG